MDELIEQLQAKAGISREQAEKAAGVFAEFLETKVSDDQIQGIAEKIPGLGQFSNRIPGDVGDKLGAAARGLFNRKD